MNIMECSVFSQKETASCENFFVELEIDKRIENKEQCFKVEIFYKVMDLVIGMLTVIQIFNN